MSSMSRLAWVFVGLWFLGLAPAYAQEKKPPEKPWTGERADGTVITQEDLARILANHGKYLETLSSDKKEGEKANLRGPT